MDADTLSNIYGLGTTARYFLRRTAEQFPTLTPDWWELSGPDDESIVAFHGPNRSPSLEYDTRYYSQNHRWFDLHSARHRYNCRREKGEFEPLDRMRLAKVLKARTPHDRVLGIILLMSEYGVVAVFDDPTFQNPWRTQFLDFITPSRFEDDPPKWLPRQVNGKYVNWQHKYRYLASEVQGHRRYIGCLVPTLIPGDTAEVAAHKSLTWVNRLRALYERYDTQHGYEFCPVPTLRRWQSTDGYYGWELRIDGFLVANFSHHTFYRDYHVKIPALETVAKGDVQGALSVIEQHTPG